METKLHYTLQEIACWAQNKTVSLPTVQRGFVWKPYQIENLWDSLLRGYPIGAFVLSSSNENKSLEMLDGQQRATAICLGFGNETFRDSHKKINIYIDLEKPIGEDNRKYIFRVITKSHPWGYRKSDNTKTLTADNIRKAMNLYDINDYLEADINLFYPFDAFFPIPFPLFVNSARNNDSTDQLLNKISSWATWSKIKDQWKNKIFKIQTEKKENPESRKELPELYTEILINNRINEIYSAVRKMIDPVDGQKIPVLYLDFEKYKRSLEYSPIAESIIEEDNGIEDNSESENDLEENSDEIENLFIRLNAGGTPLRGEELNYSILKAKIDNDLQKKIEIHCEGLFIPARFITILYRLYQCYLKKDSRDAITMRIKPKQFQKTISDSLSGPKGFEKFIKSILEAKEYENKTSTLLDYTRSVLEYDEKLNPYGLPYLITSKMADVAPEIMFMILYRILIKNDRFDFHTELHRKMLGVVSLFMWFGKGDKQKDHAKLLSNIWPSVKFSRIDLFWSSSTVQRALINETLTRFPNFDKGYDRNSLIKLSKYEVQSNSDILSKFNNDHGFGGFLNKIFYNRDLILYSQRKFLKDHFKNKQFQLDDTNVPFDWDHISPNKFVYKKFGIPKIIKDWYGTIGNLRAWPYSLNRMDQDEVPARKLDPINPEKYDEDENILFNNIKSKWEQYLLETDKKNYTPEQLKNELLDYSSCDEEWADCVFEDLKKEWKNVYRLILKRSLSIIGGWYSQLRIEELLPKDNEIFSSVVDKRRWDENPTDDKDLKEYFCSDESIYWVSKPVPFNDSCIYLYFAFYKIPEQLLTEDGVDFGIFEKTPANFIGTIIIPEKLKQTYIRLNKNIYLGRFTLISNDTDFYVELFKNFKIWLDEFPNSEIKKNDVSKTFISSLVQYYQNRITDN
jgi:Protein of unknown function DUF262